MAGRRVEPSTDDARCRRQPKFRLAGTSCTGTTATRQSSRFARLNAMDRSRLDRHRRGPGSRRQAQGTWIGATVDVIDRRWSVELPHIGSSSKGCSTRRGAPGQPFATTGQASATHFLSIDPLAPNRRHQSREGAREGQARGLSRRCADNGARSGTVPRLQRHELGARSRDRGRVASPRIHPGYRGHVSWTRSAKLTGTATSLHTGGGPTGASSAGVKVRRAGHDRAIGSRWPDRPPAQSSVKATLEVDA